MTAPKPKDDLLYSIRIRAALRDAYRELAAANYRSLNAEIRSAMSRHPAPISSSAAPIRHTSGDVRCVRIGALSVASLTAGHGSGSRQLPRLRCGARQLRSICSWWSTNPSVRGPRF